MMETQSYLSELRDINARIDGHSGAFRRDGVFCIDKFGREVSFYKPEDVDPAIQSLLDIFTVDFAAASDKGSLSLILAKFYYSLIAIHPFPNGNRRTAFAFLEERAQEKSYHLYNVELLQKLLFEGDVQGDMKNLTALFQYMLQPI